MELTAAVQEQIFTLVGKNAVDGLLGGYAGCILAYGQASAHVCACGPHTHISGSLHLRLSDWRRQDVHNARP